MFLPFIELCEAKGDHLVQSWKGKRKEERRRGEGRGGEERKEERRREEATIKVPYCKNLGNETISNVL